MEVRGNEDKEGGGGECFYQEGGEECFYQEEIPVLLLPHTHPPSLPTTKENTRADDETSGNSLDKMETSLKHKADKQESDLSKEGFRWIQASVRAQSDSDLDTDIHTLAAGGSCTTRETLSTQRSKRSARKCADDELRGCTHADTVKCVVDESRKSAGVTCTGDTLCAHTDTAECVLDDRGKKSEGVTCTADSPCTHNDTAVDDHDSRKSVLSLDTETEDSGADNSPHLALTGSPKSARSNTDRQSDRHTDHQTSKMDSGDTSCGLEQEYSCPELECSNPEMECSCPELECINPELECSCPELECNCPELECINPELECSCPELECINPELECRCPELECINPELECSCPELACSISANCVDMADPTTAEGTPASDDGDDDHESVNNSHSLPATHSGSLPLSITTTTPPPPPPPPPPPQPDSEQRNRSTTRLDGEAEDKEITTQSVEDKETTQSAGEAKETTQPGGEDEEEDTSQTDSDDDEVVDFIRMSYAECMRHLLALASSGQEEGQEDDDKQEEAAAAAEREEEDEEEEEDLDGYESDYGSDDDTDDDSDDSSSRNPNYGYCPICDFTGGRLETRTCCEFSLCRDCFSSYLDVKVTEGLVLNIQCPNTDCQKELTEYEVSTRLSSTLRLKYHKFLVDARKDPTEKTCPRCGLGMHVDKKVVRKKSVLKKGLKVTCQSCSLQWCFPCHAPWHEGVRCKDYRQGDPYFRQWTQDRDVSSSGRQANARKCPTCKVYIQRSSGCPHMTCNRCSTEFCYDCGGLYYPSRRGRDFYRRRPVRYLLGSHHSTLAPLGCPQNLLPEHAAARRLVRGSVLGAKLLGGVCALGIGVGVAAVMVVVGPVAWGVVKIRRKVRRRRHSRRR